MTAPNIVDVADIKGKSTPLTPLTTTSTNIVANQASSNSVYKINSIVVTNIDGTNAADVTVDFDRSGTPYAIVKTVSVPADASLVVMSKETSVYLEEGDTIKAYASANDDLCIAVSYEIISDQEIVLPSFNDFDEATYFGTPSASYIQGDDLPNTSPGPTGTTDYTIAIDFDSISASDYGLLIDCGGTATGFAMVLDDAVQSIGFDANGITPSDTFGDFSSYYNQQGTLYLSIDYGNKMDIYWWDGTSMNQILSVTHDEIDYVGTDGGMFGVDDGNVRAITGYTRSGTNFTGTMTGARVWNNTYYDLSTV